jgi:hypothetical protein
MQAPSAQLRQALMTELGLPSTNRAATDAFLKVLKKRFPDAMLQELVTLQVRLHDAMRAGEAVPCTADAHELAPLAEFVSAASVPGSADDLQVPAIPELEDHHASTSQPPPQAAGLSHASEAGDAFL